MNQKPYAAVENGASSPARDGGAPQDYSLRFSNLYAMLDKPKPSASSLKARTLPVSEGKSRPLHSTPAARFNALTPIPWKARSGAKVEPREGSKGGTWSFVPDNNARRGSDGAKVIAVNLLRNPRLVQPEVLPMFVGAVDAKAAAVGDAALECPTFLTQAPASECGQLAVGLHPCKPATHLHSLPSPALGEEVVVNVSDSNVFCELEALSKYSLASAASLRSSAKGGEKDTSTNAISPADEQLYDLWRKRLTMRGLFQFREELETFLYDDLWNLTSSIVLQEEYNWHQTGIENQRTTIAKKSVFVNPRLANSTADGVASETGARRDGTARVSQPALTSSTGQSVSVIPINKMESLFAILRAQLHERTVSLLQTYPMRLCTYLEHKNSSQANGSGRGANFTGSGGEMPEGAERNTMTLGSMYLNQMEQEYTNQLLKTELLLTKDAVVNGAITPATISLPEERIIKPLMVLETATSVALLWQVLKYCATSVPNVGFAMELFCSYLLPHVYENFALYASVLPSNGTLSEQIGKLSEIPLRSSMRLLSADSTQQCRKDAQYMESVLQHWALRSWRRCMLGYRRRHASLGLASKMLLRVRWQLRLQKIFSAWRLVTFQGIQNLYFNHIKKKYNSIVNSSCISTESIFLPSSSTPARSTVSHSKVEHNLTTETQTALVRSRFLALKLAENAQHVKETASSTGASPVRTASSKTTIKVDSQSTMRDPDLTGYSEGVVLLPSCQAMNSSFSGRSTPRGRIDYEEREADKMLFVKAPEDTSTRSIATGSPVLSEVQCLPFKDATCDRRVSTRDPTFDKILDLLQKENEVCTHLRSEIAIQRKRIQILERERKGLKERNRALEEDLVRTVKEKLHYCNLSQQKQFQLIDRDKLIAQLRSRLRAHRTRPWQRVTMRIIGELCGASTQISEAADEQRVRADLKATDEPRDPDQDERIHPLGNPKSRPAREKHKEEADKKMNEKFSSDKESQKDEEGSSFLAAEVESSVASTQATREAEEERLFGELAPIVLSSTTELPSAITILRDWANSCLDDLESLDDLKGGALSLRFRSFSEEVRSGVLLSRLLFYLALPRYLQRNANNDERTSEAIHSGASVLVETNDGKDEKGKYIDAMYAEEFMRRRQQLLEQRNVQLDAPFPVYPECFGDLLSLMPSDRMAMLLHFASSIVNGTTSAMSDAVTLRRQQVLSIVSSTSGVSLPSAVPTTDLHEVVDPHALALGERASIVTLLAILYIRFAHPFNHKCRQSAIVEKEAIFYLLNPRGYTTSSMARHAQSPKSESEEKNTQGQDSQLQEQQQPSQRLSWVEDDILERLIDEDKSPWQLFKERCKPIFGSSSHPFLLRGNFWPSEAFESPQLANLLGELGMALNRSLQVHRWHVLFSCLVPVTNYSRVSRGVFTGPRTSPVALRIGLRQEGVSILPPLGAACLECVYAKRRAQVISVWPSGADPTCVSPEKGSKPSQGDWKSTYVVCEKRKLEETLEVITNDMINLFLCNASLQPELALPALDLSEWRTFCVDLGIVKQQREGGKAENTRKRLSGGARGSEVLDLNFVSMIFYKAIHSCGDEDLSSFFMAGRKNQSSAKVFCSASVSTLSFDKLSDLVDNRVAEDEKEKKFMQSCDLNIFDIPNNLASDNQKKQIEVSSKATSPQLHSTLLSEYLIFPGFVTALILLVDALYQPLPPEIVFTKSATDEISGKPGGGDGEEATIPPPIVWLSDAITRFFNDYALREDSVRFEKTPQAVLKRIQMGIPTQEVLTRYSSALLLVYQNYSKEIYGMICMQEESLLQLMRDAMLTSTETTQYMISEIFQKCSTLCKSAEENAIAYYKDSTGAFREKQNNKADFRNLVNKVGTLPNLHATAESSTIINSITSNKLKRHEVQVLTLDGFAQFLCVLCHFKQPNPLIPLHQRLEIFLRRSVLRPLSKKIGNLSVLLKRQDS